MDRTLLAGPGALKTVTDAAGTRTFTYRGDLQVDEEQLGDFYDHGSSADDLKLIYGYATTGVTGRLTDFDLKAGSAYLVQDGYGYEAVTGRLNRVTGHGQTFSLSYLANSHLIEEVESGSFERHINRQTNSHRISSIENEWSQADRVNFTYSYDTLGRVSSRVMTGAIKDAYGSNTTELRDTYTYNDRHELTAAKTESKISGTYQELVGRKHAFTYDEQGNRKMHSRNSHTTTYTTNNLNQYTARTNHGFLLVEGTSGNAAVKVYETGSTEVAATRKNDYYFRDWDPDTTSTASDYPEINVKEGTAVTSTGKAWIPAVNESPTYDANGNLTADALWSYTYDEENRLIQMAETSAAATAGFPDTTITFKYDYLGRRVEKKVVRGTTTQTHLRFVWRSWLLVAELNAASNNARVRTYTWGPDVSGSFGGAGGNGGVLIFKDHTSTVNESFYPAYDAQGNVTGLIDTLGNLDAAYEYDPFGKLIRHAGTRRASMSLLYGTKYTDMETGLIYYGHRYYDPRQGRFINRDPIGEKGGINLYGFSGNSPVNGLDFLGLCESEGDTDEYGDELCDLRPFTAVEQITEEDLWFWAIQDDNTERLIEELIAEYPNHQNNVDTGNASPANNVGPKKKVKPKKEEEEGPDCDELKRQYPEAFLRPMEKIPSRDGALEDVMLGATIQSAAATRKRDTEYAALIEETSTGIYYREPVQGEIRYDDPNPYYDFSFHGIKDDIVGVTHSHDISYSEYRKIYTLASREEYLRGVERYSTRDLELLNLFDVPLGLHTKQNHLKILDPVNGIDTDQGNSFGGIPPDVVDQIIECVNSEN